jgi:hypothetical protein
MHFLFQYKQDALSEKQNVLSSIFDSSDPRTQFFDEHYTLEQLQSITQLRGFRLGSTGSPTTIKPGQNTLSIKSDNQSEEKATGSSIERSLLKLALGRIVLKETYQEKKGYVHHALLRKHGELFTGLPALATQLTIATGVLCALASITKPIDDEKYRLINSNIDLGKCEEYEYISAYDGEATSGYRATVPGVECSYGSYGSMLFSLAAGLSFGLMAHTGYVRHKQYLNLLDKEFNNPEKDSLLNELCLREGVDADIDWCCEVSVEDKTCTLRTLTLAVLSSFDADAHQHLFTELLPKLANQEAASLRVDDENTLSITPVIISDSLSMTR